MIGGNNSNSTQIDSNDRKIMKFKLMDTHMEMFYQIKVDNWEHTQWSIHKMQTKNFYAISKRANK